MEKEGKALLVNIVKGREREREREELRNMKPREKVILYEKNLNYLFVSMTTVLFFSLTSFSLIPLISI